MASALAGMRPPRQSSPTGSQPSGGKMETSVHGADKAGRSGNGSGSASGVLPTRTCSEALGRNQTAQRKPDMPVVEITCDNGKVYSTLCGDGHAVVFERTLKSRFHNALWKGNFDIKEAGADCDLSPQLFNQALCWVLSPGVYEARSNPQHEEGGFGRRRSSTNSSSMSGLRTAFSGLKAGSSAGSYRTATQSDRDRRRTESSKSLGEATSGLSKRPRPSNEAASGEDAGKEHVDAAVKKRAVVLPGEDGLASGLAGKEVGSAAEQGGVANKTVPEDGGAVKDGEKNEGRGGVAEKEDAPTGGVADMDVQEVTSNGDLGVGKKEGPRPRERESTGGSVEDMEVDQGVKRTERAVLGGLDGARLRGSIAESVLRGTMRRDNPVRKVFEEYRDAKKEIPMVEYVPMPLDGNVIYLRPRGESGLSDYLKAGTHWAACKTTNVGLKNKEATRWWDCRGGKKCVNEKCWYLKTTGKQCTRAFVKSGDGVLECTFCGHSVMSTGICLAKRYEIQGETEIAHVHVGVHSHDVGEQLEQELLDKFHEEALEAAATDPKLTAARFIQLRIREKLMERIKSGGEDVTDFASLVRSVQPLARIDRVRRTIAKGRASGGANTRGKYAVLEIAKKLGYPFVHKVFLAEQQLQPTSEVPIIFMMSVQGRGSGLHVAREMSVPGGDLYYSSLYIDAQKVTVADEVLTRLSTYSHVQRRMMTIALAIIESESKKNMVEVMRELKRCCLRGGPKGDEEGEGFWEAIEPFAFDVWKVCTDAAEGPFAAYIELFESSEGGGVLVQCEMHFKKDLKIAENNLPIDLRPQHRTLVRMWLVSETDVQSTQRFHTLIDWYEGKLATSNLRLARRKMCNWAAFWKFKSPGLGVWLLPENVKFLEEEWIAVNPGGNNAECLNARFWTMVGGKGPYLPQAKAVVNESTSAVLQIARTVEFEETGYRGDGPTAEDLRAKGEERRLSVEKQREIARRMSGEALGDVARGAGLATGGLRPRRGAWLEERLGRRVAVETARAWKARTGTSRGVSLGEGHEEAGEKDRRYYKELAIAISEGTKRLEDLPDVEREKVIDLQKMAVAGASRRPGKELESEGGAAGGNRGAMGSEDVTPGTSRQNVRGEAEEEEELILRRAKERLRAKKGDSQAEVGESEGFGAEGMGEEPANTGEGATGKETIEALPGDEEYVEGEWGICRLKRGDGSGCVGVKVGGGRCDTASFKKTRYAKASGVLVLMKQAFRHFGLKNKQGEYESTGMNYMSYAKMFIQGSCDPREGVNKSLVDKSAREKGKVIGIYEGTLLSVAELLWLRGAGWNVNEFHIIDLQKIHSEQITYRGQPKSRGKSPRNDGLTDIENESERQRREREAAAEKRAQKELEKEKREVEKEMCKRPSERPEGRKVKKVGKVIGQMETRLAQALQMETTVHVEKFVERKMLEVTVDEETCLFATRMGGRYRVTIDAAPRCEEGCREYTEMAERSSGSWVHCRRVYAVLRVGLRVFGFTDGDENGVLLVHQATFSEKEVRVILSRNLDVKAMGGEILEYRDPVSME